MMTHRTVILMTMFLIGMTSLLVMLPVGSPDTEVLNSISENKPHDIDPLWIPIHDEVFDVGLHQFDHPAQLLLPKTMGSGGPNTSLRSPADVILNKLSPLNQVEIAEFVDFAAKNPTYQITDNILSNPSEKVLQVEDPIPPIDDGQFVWGPNVGNFDIRAYLESKNSKLADFASEIDLWSRYTSLNPKILIAYLELEHGFLAEIPSNTSADDVKAIIETTSMELATAFYEHLYTWGSRKNQGNLRAQGLKPAVVFKDGSAAQLKVDVRSGSFAIASLLARSSMPDVWYKAVSSNRPSGFIGVFGALFPIGALDDGNNNINPSSLPPDNLFQFPFPLGATWAFGGPHSWAGNDTPPFSSMDFFAGGATCQAPPNLYSVVAASGSAVRPYGYECWLEVDHGGGWTTSYYHLQNTVDPQGGNINQNGSAGTIACELCAGGWTTGPHVHWSLKYNGAYVSLEGVKASGWTIHVGPQSYDTGSIERDGLILDPWNWVVNDYDTYFGWPDSSLRFYGNGSTDIDRVKVPLDAPARPVDIGTTDFTLEFWMKAYASDNTSPSCTPSGENWRLGNVIFDRGVYGSLSAGEFGISLANGKLAFGAGNSASNNSLCGTIDISDGIWHHVAVTRRLSDGWVQIYVDGQLDGEMDGPDGDLSYPDGRSTTYPNDPYLVIGAEKHDEGPSFPSFSGWIDEIRLSDNLRYATNFSPPVGGFTTDNNTAALYHFNEGSGDFINDTSGAGGGPSNGTISFGGSPVGPEWSTDTAFNPAPPTPTPSPTPFPIPTPTPSPTPSPISFALIGDYGIAGTEELDVANLVKGWNPDFIITTGDNNYPLGASTTIDANIGQYYHDFISPYTGSYGPGAATNSFYPSLGNHDWYTPNAQPYLDYFTLPGNERYYQFEWGPVTFFAIDSNVEEPDGIASDSVQAQWLQTQLGQATTPWKIVYMHHPSYSSGGGIYGSNPTLQWPFEAWGATAVLAGHNHAYERLTVGGIPYFVNGLGGRSIYDFTGAIPESNFQYDTDYGAMMVDASHTQITFNFYNRSGTLIDTFTQIRTPTFEDVPFDHWAHGYINALYEDGYVAGCSATPRLYCPDNILSRAESAVFVLRGEHGAIPNPPYPAPVTPTFADVDPAFWGYGWIESLWTDGFTAGCGINPLIYCPDNQHTRAEGSVFFLRIMNGVSYVPPAPSGIFSDVDLGAWYAGWVEAAYNEGILPSCNDSPLMFCPENELDRAWAAYMMVQAKGGLPLP